MKIHALNENPIDVEIIHEGKNITKEFLEEFILDESGLVDDKMKCMDKMLKFLNRLNEFENIPLCETDSIIINGKTFSSITRNIIHKIG